MFGMFERKPRYPTVDWGFDADLRVDLTPDNWRLTQSKAQLHFIFDDMRPGHHSHGMIVDHCTRLYTAFTTASFSLWKKKLGEKSYPIALEHKYSTVPYARIRGELYLIRSDHYKILDKYKPNGVHFLRKRIKITVPYRICQWTKATGMELSSEMLQEVEAWAYVGNPEYWVDQMDAGYLFEPVKTFCPKNVYWGEDSYYEFTPMEYQS